MDPKASTTASRVRHRSRMATVAAANRSALKRLIHRKGIAGYSEDTSRVLQQVQAVVDELNRSGLPPGITVRPIQ